MALGWIGLLAAVLLTLVVTRPPRVPDQLFEAERLHPEQVKVLDWVKYSLPHHKVDPEPGAWFLPDLFHPNLVGSAAYADFLSQVLPGSSGRESAESSDDEGATWWPFALGAVPVLGIGALFLVRRRVQNDS
jgi:MYXO-CTERM domain-containing protein